MARPPYVALQIRVPHPGRRLSAADLVAALSEQITAGHLPPGCRLPPVRALEAQLGLSKNTAQAAYDELCARGLVVARPREGAFVAATAAPHAPAHSFMAPPLPPVRTAPAGLRQPSKSGSVQLSTVFVDPDLLPRERLADCFRSVLKSNCLRSSYEAAGHPALRESIAARLQARGMDVRPADVLPTIGSQQAIDVVARTVDTRKVALEDPVYGGARALFASHNFSLSALPLCPFSGIDLEAWDRIIVRDKPGLLYAITSFQNPTSHSYSSSELAGVLAMAVRHDMALFEDDWGSDMLSGSEYRPGLRLLGGPRVLYANSFTKKLLPSLRIGFLVAPAELMPALVASKQVATLGAPPLIEAALAEFLDRGYYDTHLTTLQKELDARYQRCLTLLRDLMPQDVRWTTPGGGPTLWLEMPRDVDLKALAKALDAQGVCIEDSTRHFSAAPHLHGFRVSYAGLPEDTLARALTLVAEHLPQARGRPREGEAA